MSLLSIQQQSSNIFGLHLLRYFFSITEISNGNVYHAHQELLPGFWGKVQIKIQKTNFDWHVISYYFICSQIISDQSFMNFSFIVSKKITNIPSMVLALLFSRNFSFRYKYPTPASMKRTIGIIPVPERYLVGLKP